MSTMKRSKKSARFCSKVMDIINVNAGAVDVALGERLRKKLRYQKFKKSILKRLCY